MADVFSTMVDTYFNSALSKDAVYTPPSGSPVNCRITVAQPDLEDDFNETPISDQSIVVEVRKSDVANPEYLGQLNFDSTNHRIIKEPLSLDDDRLIWTLELEVITP